MVKGSKHGPGLNSQGVRDLSANPVTVTLVKPDEPAKADPRVCGDVPAAALEAMRKVEPVLRHFRYSHLPVPLRNVSMQFAALAMHLVSTLPRNAERTLALRDLLSAKDNAVRAALPED